MTKSSAFTGLTWVSSFALCVTLASHGASLIAQVGIVFLWSIACELARSLAGVDQ